VVRTLPLRQKSIFSPGPASACVPVAGAPHTDSQYLRLQTANNQYFSDNKTGAESGAELKHLDVLEHFGQLTRVHAVGWMDKANAL